MEQRRTPVTALGGSEQRQATPGKGHSVIMKGREHLAIEGVVHVEAFDRQEVLLETTLGVLHVRGQDLHIKELDLGTTALVVTGTIQALEYRGETLEKRRKGFIGRLLR